MGRGWEVVIGMCPMAASLVACIAGMPKPCWMICVDVNDICLDETHGYYIDINSNSVSENIQTASRRLAPRKSFRFMTSYNYLSPLIFKIFCYFIFKFFKLIYVSFTFISITKVITQGNIARKIAHIAFLIQ